MARIPPDFGGFTGYWDDDGELWITRYGMGKPQEGVCCTPLNALQLRKLLDDLLEMGERLGFITEEHRRQSGMLPTSRGVQNIMDRADVDNIIGEG